MHEADSDMLRLPFALFASMSCEKEDLSLTASHFTTEVSSYQKDSKTPAQCECCIRLQLPSCCKFQKELLSLSHEMTARNETSFF